jgi:hypothetical protein
VLLRRALAIRPLCSGQSSFPAHFSASSARVQLLLLQNNLLSGDVVSEWTLTLNGRRI